MVRIPKLPGGGWDLWKTHRWNELEKLFNENHINVYKDLSYPPNSGALCVRKITLDPSNFENHLVIDRFGNTSGKFVAPADTPLPERALPPDGKLVEPLKYKVIKSIPNVEEGKIIPWFDQLGTGLQYKFEKPVQYYIDKGYLDPIL